ncbi:hypothetical protein LCGC14_2663130, partial [marine sediment metagenome]
MLLDLQETLERKNEFRLAFKH